MKDKGNTEMGDDWRELNEDERKQRQISREGNTKAAEYYASVYGIPIISYNGGTQLSFQKGGIRLDYFPTSDKILVGNKWYNRADLETKIKEVFSL